MTADVRGPTLASTGNVYVTLAGLLTYSEATRRTRGDQLEVCRRELTALLCEARRVRDDNADGTEAWRYRSRPAGLDLHAHVTRDGPLAVVTHLRVRRY
jgi:hypothetical protein